jgi:hypothetical protein
MGAALLCLTVVAACARPVLPSAHTATRTPAVVPTSMPSTAGTASAADCGASSGRGATRPPVTTTRGDEGVAAPWPEHTVAAGPDPEVVDLAAGGAYALVSETTSPERGPYRLERTDLATHLTRLGPAFSVSELTLVAGHLWVFGVVGAGPTSSSHFAACDVDPVALSVIRELALPSARPAIGAMALADGPDGSLWIGYAQTLLRVDVATGKVVDTIAVPPNLVVHDVAVDPAGQSLYVAFAYVVGAASSGADEGDAVFEYDATSGLELARATSGPVTDSVAGASLVAVPGGVWASIGTGLMGLTMLLRQSDLAVVAPPGLGPPIDYPIDPVFNWAMDASVTYGDDTLFLAQEIGGLLACIDPRTGVVRASETLRSSPSHVDAISTLLVDPSTHLLYGVGNQGLVVITPPSSCWS